MARKTEVTVKFTPEDIRLIVRTAARWAELAERSVVLAREAEWTETGDLPRIAGAIAAELNGQAPDAKDIRAALLPGDGGVLRAMVPIARDAQEAAALRDLAKRVTVRAGTKRTRKNPDGSSVTFTAHTISFKAGRRRRSQ